MSISNWYGRKPRLYGQEGELPLGKSSNYGDIASDGDKKERMIL
jgi:hypothetical protein